MYSQRIKLFFRRFVESVFARLSIQIHDHFWGPGIKAQASSPKIDDFISFLEQVGIGEGSKVIVHSSWESINAKNIAPHKFIEALLTRLGPSGTLAMPAFGPDQSKLAVFDVRRTPSAAGLLTELFRRYPNVQRSIHLNHSVCAFGPDADYLVGQHHLSRTSWDEYSPYYRIGNLEGSWIVGFGVGHRLKVATSLHCVESILETDCPFYQKIFGRKVNYKYIGYDGIIGSHSYHKRHGAIYTPKIAKYFSKDELIEKTISGVQVYAIRADILIKRSIELGRNGKVMYIFPFPFKWRFRKL